MPSAVPDRKDVARFVANLDGLVLGAGLGDDCPIGVAVSGGPDSVALLLLAASSTSRRIRAMTVDHGLRSEGAAEAETVAALCATLGVPHRTARVGPFPCNGSLQAAARTLRYAALGDWASAEGLSAVLTAHHADDQAETLLMRLARGSGLAGLSGIRPSQYFAVDTGAMLVLRPLLGWRKTELEAICTTAGIVPVHDPSNEDGRFDRTAARALLGEAAWLDPVRLAASASYLAEAEATLAMIADERYAITEQDGRVLLRPDPSHEITRRHVRRLLAQHFDTRPDGPSLDRALRSLTAGAATTCANVLCRVESDAWSFRRAPPRRPVRPAS